MRWLASVLEKYLTPKSLTHRANVVYPSEVVDGCYAAAGFWEDDKGSVRYDFEDYVAGMVADSCIWVGVEIIHQHVAFF